MEWPVTGQPCFGSPDAIRTDTLIVEIRTGAEGSRSRWPQAFWIDRPADRPRTDRVKPRIIEAYKHGWPRFAVHQMIVRRMRTSFHRIRVQGLTSLRTALDADPSGLVMIANHACWWDIFLVHVLNESIPVDGYGMMEHFNLKRFGFFRRIGAFSVDRSDPSSLRASLDYTAELLHRPRAVVWVFPQGRMTSHDVRPLGFQPGLRILLRRAGRLRVATAAVRFEFWQDERPEVFVRFGLPTWFEREQAGTILDELETRLTRELDTLNADVSSQDPGRFEILLRGRESISNRMGRWHARFFGATPNAPPLDH